MFKVKFRMFNTLLLFLFIFQLTITTSNYKVKAETTGIQVSGNITTDTVWTKENSPYILQGDIQIKNGVTLTIEPGVEVKGNDYSIRNFGNFVAVGTEDEVISFNNTKINTGHISGNTARFDLEYVRKDGGELIAEQSNVEGIENCDFRNIEKFVISNSKDLEIKNNAFYNINRFYLYSNGKSNLEFSFNKLKNVKSVMLQDFNIISICYNKFSKTGHLGFYTNYTISQIDILNNLFYNINNIEYSYTISNGNNVDVVEHYYPIIDVSETEGNPIINVKYNSFYDEDTVFWGINNIDASSNFWNTTDVNLIEKRIKDNNDDYSIPYTINYLPMLEAPNPDTPSFATVTGIALNYTEKTMKQGETIKLIANIEPADADEDGLIWSSDNDNVARVDGDGNVTAANIGTATISAKTVDGGFTDSCKIIVKEITRVEDVKLNFNEKTIKLGENFQLDFDVIPSQARHWTHKWSSNNPAVAIVGLSGQVIGVGIGEAVITLTITDGENIKKASCKVKVESNGAQSNPIIVREEPIIIKVDTKYVTALTLNEIRKITNVGDSFQLTANIYPDTAVDKRVKWNSSNTKVAVVDENGKVTALDIGDAVIEAMSLDGGYKATCKLTVEPIRVNGIKLNESKRTIKLGESFNLTYEIKPYNSSDKRVIWESSRPDVVSVDENGKVISLKSGEGTIIVRTVDGNYTDMCKVIVTVNNVQENKSNTTNQIQEGKDYNENRRINEKTVEITNIKLNKTSLTLKKGSRYKLLATILPSNATNKKLIWISSNTKVIKVDINGNISTLNKGTAIITVKSIDGRYKASCKVTVI
ncbi:Kappa-carrageenase precursor [Caloramator mitchellensis]|uniref:Kappa-carrageenase n=1 Tax=Caloramator mitchellensis TaxID=908809 RepID=A0A0R3JU02_CALMK|nr:Ig-like domain-containing protein [Caloramator mitchellensis]KRQ86506.1 Kappa-carrageenase precursor [Caloramator mitchellensis]